MDGRGKGKELKRLQNDLKTGLSRREFVTRLKGLGLGFGAAFMFGLREAQALGAGELEEGLGLKSSNPAVDRIIGEGQSNRDNGGDAQRKVAATYARIYGRYARYTRYARYARYARYTRYTRYTRYARYGRGPLPTVRQ
jgi:hypothetical protein